MKKMANLFGIITLAALIGLSMTACDNGNNSGGNNDGGVSLEGTSWIAFMTRAQLAQWDVMRGEFASVAEAEAYLTAMGFPASFPLFRITFGASQNARMYEWDLAHSGSWAFHGDQGIWSQSGDFVTITHDDYPFGWWVDNFTIISETSMIWTNAFDPYDVVQASITFTRQ